MQERQPCRNAQASSGTKLLARRFVLDGRAAVRDAMRLAAMSLPLRLRKRRRVAPRDIYGPLARIGQAARGYLIVGLFALGVAVGARTRPADSREIVLVEAAFRRAIGQLERGDHALGVSFQ
jgi:hypothetical protein